MWGMTDLTKENFPLSFPPIGANFPTPSFLTLRIALILKSHSLSHSSSLTHTLSFFLALSPPSCSHMYEYEQKHSPRASNLLTHTLPSSLLARFFSFFLIHTFSHSRSLSHFHSHAHTHTHTLSLFLSDTLSLTALAAIITDASEQHPFFSAAAPPSSFLPVFIEIDLNGRCTLERSISMILLVFKLKSQRQQESREIFLGDPTWTSEKKNSDSCLRRRRRRRRRRLRSDVAMLYRGFLLMLVIRSR